ncbi:unnamed protein product, partial [Vitis vinifera]
MRQKVWCNCDICCGYLTSSWLMEFGNLCDWYTHLLQKSPTHTIHIHVLGNTITANPDNVEYMLKTRFDNYPKGKPFSTILGDLLGKGIFNVDGDSWVFQRKMASLELGSVSIRSFAFEVVMAEIKHRLLPLLSSYAEKDGSVLDLQDVFRRFTFDNICKFSFGLDPERAMVASPLIWKIKRLLNLGSERRLKEAIKKVNDDDYLRDIVISFILAGRDTMASALTTFFWLVATHPEVESKIRDEADRIMHPNQEFPSFELIREMHYLHAAVHESLRLYPPVQFDSKFARQDDVLRDGTFVMKGTRVTYHPYAMGRIEAIWGPDCMEFRPQRWLNNGTFFPQSPFKFPVFQAGIRVCLGKEMAVVAMKSVAAAVLRPFNIHVVHANVAPRFDSGLTATVRGGLPVVFVCIATILRSSNLIYLVFNSPKRSLNLAQKVTKPLLTILFLFYIHKLSGKNNTIWGLFFTYFTSFAPMIFLLNRRE